MEQIYRAFDGTIFEDEDDCLAYEQMAEMKDANIYFADDDGEQITLEEIITQAVSVDDIAFIKCGTYEDYEKLCNLFDEFSIRSPEEWGDKTATEARCWYWDNNAENYYGAWVNLLARIDELERLKAIYEKVLSA